MNLGWVLLSFIGFRILCSKEKEVNFLTFEEEAMTTTSPLRSETTIRRLKS